jgi:hypothetical protein
MWIHRKDIEEMDELTVERIGGFAGFGTPGSRLRSVGTISISNLRSEDVQTLERLFRGATEPSKSKPDAFRYRLTRKIGGKTETVEVDEEHVPVVIRNSVKDTLD